MQTFKELVRVSLGTVDTLHKSFHVPSRSQRYLTQKCSYPFAVPETPYTKIFMSLCGPRDTLHKNFHVPLRSQRYLTQKFSCPFAVLEIPYTKIFMSLCCPKDTLHKNFHVPSRSQRYLTQKFSCPFAVPALFSSNALTPRFVFLKPAPLRRVFDSCHSICRLFTR